MLFGVFDITFPFWSDCFIYEHIFVSWIIMKITFLLERKPLSIVLANIKVPGQIHRSHCLLILTLIHRYIRIWLLATNEWRHSLKIILDNSYLFQTNLRCIERNASSILNIEQSHHSFRYFCFVCVHSISLKF